MLNPKLLLAGLSVFTVGVLAQSTPPDPTPATPAAPATIAPKSDQDPVDKRVLGVLPNYRTANDTGVYEPLTTRQKFYIGTKDSTDYPVFPLAAAFSALGQIDNAHPAFGQGLKGFGHRYITALGDQIIGNYMTESIMPSLLHEDPRYFRRGAGHGSTWNRLGYAATRIFVTRTDSGGTRFNFSEVVGNAFTAGLANAYYPGERKLSDNLQRFGTQLSTDAFSQVLKEFWPDIKKKWFKK